MKNIKNLSLLVIASFVFAFVMVPGCDIRGPANASVSKSNTGQTTTITHTEVAVQKASITEENVRLEGKSTYGLSTCPARFTPIENTIDRMKPATPPPIS